MRHLLIIKPILRWAVLIGVLLLVAVTMMAAKRDSDAQKAVPVDQKTAQADPSQYVGSDTCKGCHDEAGKSIEASPHSKIGKKVRGEPGHGCESCHGPGAAHVEGGGDKAKIFNFKGVKPDQITKRCMTCHESNPEQREFVRSTHNENGITCTSCHSVHHSTLEYQLVKKQTPLCFSCHAEQKGDFQKPFHHRVEEGLIQCGDCHNAHGALVARQLRTTSDQNFVCFKCHSDKRGPFVYEHEPVKVEGCTSCHFPHGSTNPRMLNTSRVNSLCLQCHVFTSGHVSVHPQNTYRQACIACHSSIHGSNTDARFFKP